MSTFNVAVVVGSNRKDSINKKLAHALVKLGGANLTFDVIQIDDLPMYNMDMEADRPAAVNRFTAQVAASNAVLIVTPEHNRSLPAVLKNAIDWGSKPADKNVWKKPTAIIGTSPGAIGTAAAQQHLRQILGTLGATVMGSDVYIQFKPDLMDGSFVITNSDTQAFLQKFMNQFAVLIEKLH
jgi:chromate reductase